MTARPLFLRHRDWAPILNLAFLILCGIAGVAAVCYGSFQLGRYLAIDEARAAAAKIGIAVRMPSVAQPDTLIGCPVNTHRLREWERTCRARDRITKVGP